MFNFRSGKSGGLVIEVQELHLHLHTVPTPDDDPEAQARRLAKLNRQLGCSVEQLCNALKSLKEKNQNG